MKELNFENFKNSVEITARVAPDRLNRPSIQRVSKNMTRIITLLSTGKDRNGDRRPMLQIEVHVFGEGTATPTKLSIDPQPGEYITIRGRLTQEVKEKGDKKFYNTIINADEIVAVEQ